MIAPVILDVMTAVVTVGLVTLIYIAIADHLRGQAK